MENFTGRSGLISFFNLKNIKRFIQGSYRFSIDVMLTLQIACEFAIWMQTSHDLYS